jgi:hypothetical protein
MYSLPDVEYKVLLIFPGFGEERQNAETIVEEALQHLNTYKEEPGFRFAPNVSASLDIVLTAEEAYARLQSDDDLATMILHDLPEEEKIELTKACAAQGVPVCHTVYVEEEPRRRRRSSREGRREWHLEFRQPKAKELRAHQIAESTLTASLDDDPEEVGERIGQLIAVLALGVMEFHWGRNPPNYDLPECEPEN